LFSFNSSRGDSYPCSRSSGSTSRFSLTIRLFAVYGSEISGSNDQQSTINNQQSTINTTNFSKTLNILF
jgi:hypothetical protein